MPTVFIAIFMFEMKQRRVAIAFSGYANDG